MSQILSTNQTDPTFLAQSNTREARLSQRLSLEKMKRASKQDRKSLSTKKSGLRRFDLQPYEAYLRKRYTSDCILPTGNVLFQELRCRGYLGSIGHLRKFITQMRREMQSSKMFLSFHQNYLIKRMEENAVGKLSTRKLFEEIKERGYRGSTSHLQKFLTKIRGRQCSSRHALRPYEGYLIERMTGIGRDGLSGEKLFRELKEKGYKGSIRMVQMFLKTMQIKYVPPEAFLHFHEKYLIERIKETRSNYVSTNKLFEEITKKGYRGRVSSLQRLVTAIRKDISFEQITSEGYGGSIKTVQAFLKKEHSRGRSSAVRSLDFHRDYLVKRIEESHPNDLASSALFAEIKEKGYRGTLRRVQTFVSVIRRAESRPEAGLDFHKNYLIKRLQENSTSSLSAALLFEEIKKKGYRGTSKEVQTFVSSQACQKDRYSKVFFRAHKEHLIKRVQETPSVSGHTLFEELKARGYRGSLKTVLCFFYRVRRDKRPPESRLHFHEDYLMRRIKESPLVSAKKLFEEIKTRGYRGSVYPVQKFLKKVSSYR